MWEIKRYNENFKNSWDLFLDNAKNSVFLFKRSYMDYHSHIFTDHSILVFDSNNTICAVMPANVKNDILTTHGGLTFGGLVLSIDLTLKSVLEIFEQIKQYYQREGIKEIIYKSVPGFYHAKLAQEDLYALFISNAELIRRDAGFVIDKKLSLPFQERRKRGIRKGIKNNIEIKLTNSFDDFWNSVLEPNLKNKFGLTPVHSLAEISYLKTQCPDNIIQFNAYCNDEILAGATIFLNKTAVHAQYISANDKGRDMGALDLLFNHLINNEFSEINYFSFGISSDKQGRYLNEGLAEWKEGFGARTWVQDFYSIKL